MKKSLSLVIGLLAISLLPLTAADAATFPKKNPVITYEAPAKWKTVVNEKDGSTAVNSPDGRISINFAETPVAASMEVFEKMLPAMLKTLDEPVVSKKPEEHSEDGLTGYSASYTAKVDGKPAMCMFALFKGGKERSVLACIVVGEPDSLPKEDDEAMGKFMGSMKGVAADDTEKPEADEEEAGEAESYPEKKPIITYAVPEKWTSEADEKDGSIAINSDSEKISVNFAEVPMEASVASLEKLLPEMTKKLAEAAVTKKPAEHTEGNLTGYSATYSAKIDDKPAVCIFVLFKGSKERSVLGCFVIGDPENLSKEDNEAMGSFMTSLKAAK